MDVLAHDAKGSGLWLPRLQTDNDVVPSRIWGLGDVGTAGVCLGVGMAVRTPNDLKPVGFGGQLGAEMLFGVDCVDHRAVGDVGAGHKPHNFRGCRVSYKETTHLFGVTVDAVRRHCGSCFSGHGNEVLG